jgi:hypothetical protein
MNADDSSSQQPPTGSNSLTKLSTNIIMAVGARPKFSVEDSVKNLKHKRRYCRQEGCSRIVKSQGLCQRHGAKPRECKMDGCEKQAQGNFDRMCKSHFKAMKRRTTPIPQVPTDQTNPPPAEGASVYLTVLPASISFNPHNSIGEVMPLIEHLKHGFENLKPPAWHRNEERRSRGLFPISNPATQLEGWERELVWMEILVLTGAPNASFRHLARAWGRDKGFHMVLAQFICERQGSVERKKRQGLLEGTSSQGGGDESPPKRRRRGVAKKTSTTPGVISADIWDDSAYGDADYNESLAADIFNFSAHEFASVSQRFKNSKGYQESPPSTPSPAIRSNNRMAEVPVEGVAATATADGASLEPGGGGGTYASSSSADTPSAATAGTITTTNPPLLHPAATTQHPLQLRQHPLAPQLQPLHETEAAQIVPQPDDVPTTQPAAAAGLVHDVPLPTPQPPQEQQATLLRHPDHEIV